MVLKKVTEQKIFRLIDANINRSKEGLRVCEDIERFIFDDKILTRCLKRLRHQLSRVALELPISQRQLVSSREASSDVGKNGTLVDRPKIKWDDIIVSNFKRSQESLRVLEEVCKTFSKGSSDQFQRIRFKVYELEKKVLTKL
jgi:hypothetical protein